MEKKPHFSPWYFVAGRSRAAATGVALSHTSCVLFPRTAITKIDPAHYYEIVAERMLPYLRDRPLADYFGTRQNITTKMLKTF